MRHVKGIIDLVVDRRGRGWAVSVNKSWCPINLEPMVVFMVANLFMDSLCDMTWNSGLGIFHLQKTAHWVHWISFNGHLKKIFYSGGQKNWIWPKLVGSPIKQNIKRTHWATISLLETLFHLNLRIKEISTGAPFGKCRCNVLY